MKRLRTLYFVIANTAIVVLLIEAGAHVAIRTVQWIRSPDLSYARLTEPARRNYAHMTPAEVDDLLRVTGSLRFRYAPIVGFVQEATTSRFVNIDAYGIRSNGSAHREISAMQDAIWFFGGSTTLGFGVADRETIPAQLEHILARPVMNLGVRAHASPMENRLLNHYLRLGYRPAVAIFLDGINESCDQDLFDDELGKLVAQMADGYTWRFGEPVLYGYARVSRKLKRMMGMAVDPPDIMTVTCTGAGRRIPLRTIHARTMAERGALCGLYRIECRTFVQPFAGIHGRHDDPAFVASLDAKYLRDLWEHLESSWRDAGAAFVTDALDRSHHHAFVDSAHYSAEACRLIAEAIALKLR